MKSRLLLLPLLAVLVLVATAAYVPGDEFMTENESSATSLLPALRAQTESLAVDTLPQGSHEVTKISDGKTTRLRVEDGEIKELELEGEQIPEEDFPRYEDKAEELLGIRKARRRGFGDSVMIFHPIDFDGPDSAAIYRVQSALENMNFDFEFPAEELEKSLAILQVNMDSLTTNLKTLKFDAFDGDIFLDADLELMDSVYTRSIDGMRIYRHRLEHIEEIDNLDELRQKEEVLQKALKEVEERKEQLRTRGEGRGEAMLQQGRETRDRALENARQTREALMQRRYAPESQYEYFELPTVADTEAYREAISGRYGQTVRVKEVRSKAKAEAKEVLRVKRTPEPVIFYEYQNEPLPALLNR